MIFSIADHIEQIKAGTKTQTRRPSNKYQVHRLYSIQPRRGKKGIPDGKIYVVAKRREVKIGRLYLWYILENEALAEGGYTPLEYEELYEKMYPDWMERYCYLFKYYPTKAIEMMNRGEFPSFLLQDSSRSPTE